MGFSCFLLILFFFSFDPTVVSSSSSDLIHQTCKNTKYYDLCVSSLKSDSSSSKAADTKHLAVIMVKVGIANATATNSYLSSQMLSVPPKDTWIKKVMSECADKYSFASDALQTSVGDLSDESYDYAYMHVMAAKDYPNACHNSFKSYPQLVYPPRLALREDALERICDVILGIIDALAF